MQFYCPNKTAHSAKLRRHLFIFCFTVSVNWHKMQQLLRLLFLSSVTWKKTIWILLLRRHRARSKWQERVRDKSFVSKQITLRLSLTFFWVLIMAHIGVEQKTKNKKNLSGNKRCNLTCSIHQHIIRMTVLLSSEVCSMKQIIFYTSAAHLHWDGTESLNNWSKLWPLGPTWWAISRKIKYGL